MVSVQCTEADHKLKGYVSWLPNSRRKSLVISKLSQLLAILGATFSRFGTMPLYIPLYPSWAVIVEIASHIDLY